MNHDYLPEENGMNKPMFSRPSTESVASALSAWRILLLAALIGGLIGAACYQLWLPPYRAMSKVVVDQNLEQVLPESPDREVFYFLERETQKLEELTWSDAVLAQVAAEIKGVNVSDLRNGFLQLSQPGDGGWKFYGISQSPEQARQLSKFWAKAFNANVQQAVLSSNELVAVKNELSGLENNLSPESQQKRESLEARAIELEASSFGLHPEIQVYQSQKNDLVVERITPMGSYIFTGAVSTVFIMLVVLVMSIKTNGQDDTQS